MTVNWLPLEVAVAPIGNVVWHDVELIAAARLLAEVVAFPSRRKVPTLLLVHSLLVPLLPVVNVMLFTLIVLPLAGPVPVKLPMVRAFDGVDAIVMVFVPLLITTLPASAMEPLKVPVWEAFAGALAVKIWEAGILGLLIVVCSSPVVSLDKKVPEKVPVLDAKVAFPV